MHKIFSLLNDHTACGDYRKTLPWAHCREDLQNEDIQIDLKTNLDISEHYDSYIFHRLINPSFIPILLQLKMNQKSKIVWDLDDNLFKIPYWSCAREMTADNGKECLALCLQIADYITVSTSHLKSQLAEMNPEWEEKIYVLPNLISNSKWNYNFRKQDTGVCRILWAGSATHTKDLDFIAEPVEECIKKYENNVEFVFFGLVPDLLTVNPRYGAERNRRLIRHVRSIATNALQYYPSTLDLLAPDIAIIPVVDCDFNRAKSNIKYLEMSMANAVSIASNVGPYRDTINHSFNGFLVNEDRDLWTYCLSKTIDMYFGSYLERQRFYEIANKAKQKTLEEYSWDSNRRNLWMDFFRLLAN